MQTQHFHTLGHSYQPATVAGEEKSKYVPHLINGGVYAKIFLQILAQHLLPLIHTHTKSFVWSFVFVWRRKVFVRINVLEHV